MNPKLWKQLFPNIRKLPRNFRKLRKSKIFELRKLPRNFRKF